MARLGKGRLISIVSPAFVLLGYAENQRVEFRADARASRVGVMLRAVQVEGNQTAILGGHLFRSRRQDTSARHVPRSRLRLRRTYCASACQSRRRPKML